MIKMNYWEEKAIKTQKILDRTESCGGQMPVTTENLKKLIKFYEKMSKKESSN